MADDEQAIKRRKSESNKRYYQKRKQLELQDPKLAEADKERKKRNQRDKRARDRSKVQEEGPWPMVLDLTGDAPTFDEGLAVRLHHTDSPSAKTSSEVPPTEDVVQWPNGQTTVLPTVMRDGRNVCEGDAKYVRQLATLPLSMPGSHHVEHIDPIGVNDADLCQRVEETLRGGRCAVVRGAAKPGPEKLTAEYLVERGIPPWLRTTHHDMEQRAIGKVHPCIDATIDQLLSGADDPKELRCALDIPLPACTLPQPFQLLDHAFVCAWAHTMHILPFHKTRLHPDLLLYRRWANIYQGGTLTLPRHTSNGFGTSFSVVGCMNFFIVYRLKDRFLSRDQTIDQFLALCEIDYDRPQLPDGLEAEIVDLRPGDLLFMPPGQFYARYAGLLTYEEVGTFLRYDTMHLSEWSLFLDNSHGKTYTGQERKGTFVTLRRMMAALPYMPLKTYHRPTVALALMILDPISYVSQQRDGETPPPSSKTKTIEVVSGGEFDSKDCVDSAMKIARRLLLHLELDDTEAVGVLDDSAWDAVGDQLHLEKVWDNSNAIESDDGP
ncbi:uncharacterized protein HD556DRAFT_1449017 [Suillus plorans]|uniref:JmjC domain-containing protein n=1 Tax=Suillus plorans TaxID=116603 RepID=A0A9P7ADN4_9AGAM|nr:uncharacterized protein HD556DRAFT_1449017 [Suillus plorans]KAG1787218.1 hypothetical protein HD556DRAFT_1449017 [Suillus plorans]